MAIARPGSRVIVHNVGIHSGEPIVRGTRVPVRSIVIEFERYNGDVAQVARGFTISPADVRAALAYYEGHRAEIDQIIEQRERDAMA